MTDKQEAAGVFEQIVQGLEDSIAYSRGELSLVTTTLPEPPPRARRRDVTRLRKQLRMSQAVFAAVLNVSPKTVQSWEHGSRQPSQAALRTIQIIRQRPDVLESIFHIDRTTKPGRAGRNGTKLRRTRVQ